MEIRAGPFHWLSDADRGARFPNTVRDVPLVAVNGEKVVLGHRILSGGGMADGERVLDILAAHPATARFIATKLARRFISDNPPQSVIDRAAAVFLKTDGSIRETLRTIVTSPEFFAQSAYRAKMRSPSALSFTWIDTFNPVGCW